LTAALVLGMAASPSLAVPAHPWEATSPHFTSRREADAVAAQAQRKGLRTVIQVISSNNIEVEYGNGFATQPPADAVCAKVKSNGLACSTQQEFHGATYTPAAGFSGTDTFTDRVSDGTAPSNAATAAVTVKPTMIGRRPHRRRHR
jgi:hypothetical protein